MKLSYRNSSDIDKEIYALIEKIGCDDRFQHKKRIRDMILTALKLAQDGADLLDVKILDTALKEIRYSYKVFAPYRQVKKVSIFGSARTLSDDLNYQLAEQFAKRLVEFGFMVITGGGGGIMEAAQKGAGKERSFGINISLPFEQKPNSIIAGDPKSINFHYFFARKLFFLKETSAIALFPGGFGTFDEGFEALTLLQTGKRSLVPMFFIDHEDGGYWNELVSFFKKQLLEKKMITEDDFNLFTVTGDIEAAALEILRFYHNYHSMRYIGKTLVLRLKYPVNAELLSELNENFSDILSKGTIRSVKPYEEEFDEQDTLNFHRIAFSFNRRSFGRLREMINLLNR